ncbi:hypothetical protein BP5796_03938 [Coleophoma crateriformis]|uniref:Aldehyde dehydrogenase domain-containing protein n=1 Tax=Coleophoma crateriformis TaxID=565419 RepID=A0A3D8SH38_9HELO|nr:hypothetical protein BP5796_03938 [Coleophoma crateriformis]
MAKSLDASLQQLLAAVTDGRTENTRYRQNELHRLHAGLKVQKETICEAISKSASIPASDAEIEYVLAMDSINQLYMTLDFDESMKKEYLVTTGVNNTERRVGLGLVAVRPSKHSRFYSAVTPIAAAIAAGNCVLLEVENSAIDALLSSLLSSSLDQDTFYVSNTPLSDSQLQQVNLRVNQTSAISKNCKELISTPTVRSVAVVDRIADIPLAVKSIVDARLFSNGTSPYSPDLILVNNWTDEAFRKACLAYALSLASEKPRPTSDAQDEIEGKIKSAESNGQVKVYKSVPGLTLIEVLDRKCSILTEKIEGPYIMTLSSTGLVDSVSFLRTHASFLSAYHFSDAKSAKFLSEQISSSVSYINQIPTQLLVGPASPLENPHQIHPRYTPHMFSQPRPQIIEPTKAINMVVADLKPTGQKPGHAVGFFEQGILIGLGITACVVFPSVGYGVFRLGREAWRYAALRRG